MFRWLASIASKSSRPTSPISSSPAARFQQAVDIVRSSPDTDDFELFHKFVAHGFERPIAARLIEFLAMAYTRAVFENAGPRFPDCFERRLPDGSSVKLPLDSEPIWVAALEFAKGEIARRVSKQDLMAIAGRSAEFAVMNKLLKSGSTIEDLSFTPTLLLWGEDGPVE